MVSASKEQPDSIDVRVGIQVRVIRKARGISLGVLASQIGVTYQQVQKYESGANRISASMLVRIARALQVRIGDFFPEEEGGTDISFPKPDLLCLTMAQKIESLEPHLQRSLAELVEALAAKA